MFKGVRFYFGFEGDAKKRARLIKDVGFDGVITSGSAVFKRQNGSLAKQMKLFKKNGLQPSSLHARYSEESLPHFFLADKIGDKVEKRLIEDIKIAKKYGFRCLVVHLVGKISLVGVERFKRILKVCEKEQMTIALENLEDLKPLCFFLDNFKSPYVKFCYDVGHENCFTKKAKLLERYGKRLICVHLHDNDGKNDDHTLNRFGTINWQKIAKDLAKTSIKWLDYELKVELRELSAEDVLIECKKQADELEKMILEERRKIKVRMQNARKKVEN